MGVRGILHGALRQWPPCCNPRSSWRGLACLHLRSDVTFVVGRERQEVFAHRCILACRCQTFQGMLCQPQPGAQEPWPPQTPLVLSHVQPEVFLAVIEFLYTNSVTLNSLIVSAACCPGAGRPGKGRGGSDTMTRDPKLGCREGMAG